ncbi:MAG: long-chain fatty acid--CoA ligase [Geminicoccaceae bacterium]|nr:long-chain fatty acid--CoA ligase [Geminicoccaceae bacterium]HRY25937.1 AMP-dependent synthetase/ligase [Geminicoccaceae bacterium]
MPTFRTENNLLAMFEAQAAAEGDSPFLWQKRDGVYQPWSWRRVAEEAGLLARAFRQLGLEPGDRVVLVAENRPEWCIADLAILGAGGITVPAYTTNTERDHAYILGHSEARMVVCAGRSLAKRLIPAIKESPTVKALLFIEPLAEFGELPVSAMSWADALALGERSPAVPGSAAIQPDDVACFIYTSGTGGTPKGVMQTHRNIQANLEGAYELLSQLGIGDREIFLSFLPLSHSYEHTAGQFFPISLGAEIYYAEGVETLSTNLVEARPTILTCVPRLYEVLRQKILVGVNRQGGLQKWLFEQAIQLGTRRYEQGGRLGPLDGLFDALLERLVRTKVNERFGGRLKAMISGGAPLNYDVGLFFAALGLPVLQGYGQTEAAPVISVNVPGRARHDTVGPPVRGVELRFADDGEIQVRGANVMKGYWKDEEATARTVVDGWLHTGDVGVLDEHGYLKITDRKKDIIVNSGGDNISPQRVEGILLLEPEIGQALIYGDRKPYLVALVTPDPGFVQTFGREAGKSRDPAALAQDPEFRQRIGEAVKRANANLSAIERIRKYEIMAEPFSVENGMMTPTMKLRRPRIIERHGALLEGLYAAGK